MVEVRGASWHGFRRTACNAVKRDLDVRLGMGFANP